jgi:hypothetical protein
MFTFQAAIAATDASSAGPSKMLFPCTQANSAPERFTPCGTKTLPVLSRSWLPETCSAGAPVDGGVELGVVLGVVVGVVLGVVDGVVLGVVDGEDGVEPLHVVPLTLNDVGAALVPL